MNIDKIKEIIKQSDQLSENIDPDRTPYKSKFEAIELLKELKSNIIKENNETFNDYLITIDSKLGELYFQTDEITLAITIFNETLKSLEKVKEKYPIEYISINQTLSIISINNNEFKQGEERLKECETLLNQELQDEASKDKETIEKLNSLQLQNFFYFAQLYTLTGESEESSKYIELTLNKQLKKEKFDKIEWCKNSLLLGDYYLKIKNFDYSRQCFLASTFIFKKIDEAEFTENEQKEELQASINLFIGKFFLEFLHVFRDIEYLNHAHKEGNEDENIDFVQDPKSIIIEKENERKQFEENQKQKEILIDSITFNKRSLNIDNPLFKDSITVEQYNSIASSLFPSSNVDLVVVKDQPSARDIFLKSQHFYNRAKKFYQLDGFVTQHLQILFDLIDLFDYLNIFETLANRKIAINKKRVDLIEPLIKELNPTYFLAQLRKIFYKLAEIYNETSRIYQFACANLREIQNYNDCSYNQQSQNEQERKESIIDDFDVYINSKLGLAMCHKKVKGVNKLVNEHLDKSLEVFKSIVKLFDDNNFLPNEIKEKYAKEYSLSQQMVSLLTEKSQFIQSKMTSGKWYEKNNQ
ncbi:hypothetical protein DICPUDRAFT_150496 [Dictyostelium purpureum]|uniref:KIF-binding protein n=1 Tax=Dictyostelium purpureum TaxID=5786 RepID=F0ZGG8_DICPU|nr:uncharacterized protein DICPUDRAFT_150496 [Dictyostelium purpureum]EGC36940.1 hypothetical protein DICPUDRAFT_150496 [Dictyostelium purpureum]|eukprot:XP_003286508.1 hypothetical protein DICPUDRAFT_150496 [Dictyostelium purpureum]